MIGFTHIARYGCDMINMQNENPHFVILLVGNCLHWFSFNWTRIDRDAKHVQYSFTLCLNSKINQIINWISDHRIFSNDI